VIDQLKAASAKWDSEIAVGNRGAFYAQDAYEFAIELLEHLQKERDDDSNN
jgi:hypothetical protein